jgi:hypothetical protein
VPCSWCPRPATWVLLADADLHNHDHRACDEHKVVWGHLYRRAVAVREEPAVDLRDDVDLREGVDEERGTER